jgi:hypothetical protein
MDKYEIKNGLLGMKRDINIKLSSFLDENKKRQLHGVSLDYFIWKNHFLYKILNRFPRVQSKKGKIKLIPPNTITFDSANSCFEIIQRLPLNTGKYILKIKPIVFKFIFMIISEGLVLRESGIFSFIKNFYMSIDKFMDGISIINIASKNNDDKKSKNYLGILKKDDNIKIEIDTNNKVIKCIINNINLHEFKYKLLRPLVIEFNLSRFDMINIESFQHFNKSF